MKKINTEEPDVHWSFLHPKDKIVLDLGCGKFYSSISTAEWFINQGAKKVIGIDLSDVNFKNEHLIVRVQRIDSSEKIKNLISEFHPQIIKCDIEGAEKYLDLVSLPGEVEEVAIEYHDNNTKNICEKKMKEWEMKDVELYQLFNESIERIGVIYGKK